MQLLGCGDDQSLRGQLDGSDLSASGGCPPPPDTFACGPFFCAAKSDYCERQVSDTPPLAGSFTCKPLPISCSPIAICDCLAGEPCGQQCEELPSGDLMVTCPGG